MNATLISILKHQAGKHSQASHRRGRGGSSSTSKKWTEEEFANGDDEKAWKSWYMNSTKGEDEAIRHYSGSRYEAINGYLRGMEEEQPTVRESIEALDSVLKKGSIPEDTIVYRGMDPGLLEGLKAGDSFKDKGYVSTSLSEKAASEFGWMESPAEIRVPKGFNGGYVDMIQRMSPTQRREYELLLPRGTSFRMLSTDPKVVMEVIDD